MDRNYIGRRLFALRDAAGETQEEVASAIGVSNITLSRYENGARVPVIGILRKLADHFNVSVDSITSVEYDETEKIDNELAEVDFALSGAIRSLSREEKMDVLDYVRFKQSQKRK